MALSAIDEFIANNGPLIRTSDGIPELIQERAWAVLVLLASFETEMSFLLSDVQQTTRVRSERAFLHLQRSIVVDEGFREKWVTALESGEVACERLGAVHLLLHGIWAFKVNAMGERTDLVFQEKMGEVGDENQYVDGLVLTEWKTVDDGQDAARKFSQARSQAQRYSQGALAGNELAGYRYVIVVSKNHVTVPPNITNGAVTYRHLNIAVNPLPPSRSKYPDGC